jgi:hypothetical protein
MEGTEALPFAYSYRKAIMGSTRAAFLAGKVVRRAFGALHHRDHFRFLV